MSELLPALPEDSLAISKVIHYSYSDNAFYRAIWLAPQEELIRATTLRWPKNLWAEDTWHLKLPNPDTGEIVSYSRWILPDFVLNQVDDRPSLTAEQTDAFAKSFHGGCENGAPKHLNTKLADVVEANAEEARKSFPSGNVVKLDMINVLPEFQGKGYASKHIQWGIRLADQYGLPMTLEATEAGRDIYAKYGFEEVTRTVDDLEPYGGDGKYTHYFMVRPSKK